VQHAVVSAFDSQAGELVISDVWVANWHPGS
jgi:hypothetical protein